MSELRERLGAANALIQGGRLADAEAALAALAGEAPGDHRVPYLRAIVARAGGRPDRAVDHLERALLLNPDDAGALSQLAACRRLLADRAGAERAYRDLLARDAGNGEALLGLAELAFDRGAMVEAADLLAQARAAGAADDAVRWRLGVALVRQGKPREALAVLEDADGTAPEDFNARLALGEAYSLLGLNEPAIALFEDAVRRKPDSVPCRSNAAKALRVAGRYRDAERHLREAVRLQPQNSDLRGRLGLVLQNMGRMGEALAEFETGARLDPVGLAASNRLFALHYDESIAAAEVADAHRDWGRHFQDSLGVAAPRHGNARDPDRRLRVGYLSPDLRRHSVAYFAAPLFAAHDRDTIEVHAFFNGAKEDAVSERLRGLADRWHTVTGLDDEGAAAAVRKAGIDVLVDLAGHTGGGRLGMFARRPAPVQATWLGYPDTTGLATMDYRLTDACADPPGAADTHSVEALVRLPGCFLCYEPAPDAPDVALRPADAPVVFGSFNTLAKLGDGLLGDWARLLDAVPGSRLLIKATTLADPAVQQHLAARLDAAGIRRGRVILHGPVEGHVGHLSAYGEIDIALDPSPYNGTTTTCEALHMGVPVVTRAGDRHSARVGATLLGAVGLDDLVTRGRDDYVATAIALARDPARRAELRRTLRDRLAGSPLCDGAAFARKMEDAYRGMWRRWCDGVRR